MAELKTKLTTQAASEFLDSIESETKKQDSFKLLEIFEKVTGEKAQMWGASIIGFGKYHYKSDKSTQEGDWPLVAFSPRKQNLTLYILSGSEDSLELLQKLGKHKVSGGCLYINKLEDIDTTALQALIKSAYLRMKKKHL